MMPRQLPFFASPGLALALLVGLAAPAARAAGDVCLPFSENALFVAECGACHVPYSPALLPKRSWLKMMAELDRHFDSDATLSEAERAEIEAHLLKNAADSPEATCRMRRISGSLSRNKTPLRVTETPFFQWMHEDLRDSVWKRPRIGGKANCGACHPSAARGDYSGDEVKIPR